MAEERDDLLVENDEEAAAQREETSGLYEGLIQDNEDARDEALGGLDEHTAAQKQAQTDLTNQTIREQKQQQEWAEKDYIKEQTAARTDYEKATARHGANAEMMAANGLWGSGYAESSQVSMYNALQNRIAVSREAFLRSSQDYDNQIARARIEHSAAMAEIASKAWEQRTKLIMEFAARNATLQQSKDAALRQIDRDYWTREYQILQDIRANEQLALQREQFAWQKEQAAKAEAAARAAGTNSLGKSRFGSGNSTQKIKNSVLTGGAVAKGNAGDPDKDYEVDNESLLAATGKGAPNAETVEKMIKNGEIIEYVEDGKLKYKKAISGNPTQTVPYTQTNPTGNSVKDKGFWQNVWDGIKSIAKNAKFYN